MGAAQGLDIKFPFGATAKFALGAAYLQTFSTRDELQFEDGEFVDRPDGGNARFMPSTSLGLGYRFFHDSLASPQVFINYQTWFELPYSPGFIPVMAHSSLHLGFTFPLWGRRNGQ